MHRFWCYVLIISMSVMALSGCNKSDVTSSESKNPTPTATPSPTPTPEETSDPISWSGLDSIELIAGDSFKLLWTAYSGTSDNYKIYNVSGSSGSLYDTVSGDTTAYTFTGQNLGESFTFRVRVVSSGTEDTNTVDRIISTLAITGTHGGWEHVKALGGRTPVSHSGLATTNPSVFLKWKTMTTSSSTIASYNIYRADSSGGQNFSSPLATSISPTLMEYTDSFASAGSTYYYVVRPVVGGEIVPTIETDSEIKIVTPPSNMSLVHRWIANQYMCEVMGKTPDRDNNYRCAYTGLSNTGGFYDLGYSLLVDTVEMGCNYSLAACDGTNDCISASVSNPDTTVSANEGTIFFSRNSKTCYINTSTGSGTSWSRVRRSGSLSTSQINLATSINPGLPPIGGVIQGEAWTICQAKTLNGFSGSKRLLRRKEFVVAAAWDSSLSDGQINTIKNGTNLSSSKNCNVSTSHGVTHEDVDIPSDLETLPQLSTFYTSTQWAGLLRSGGNYTSNCVSRFGIQNMVGNSLEWNSDQCIWSGGNTCSASGTPLDVDNTDVNGWVTVATSSEQFSTIASYFLPALGLPWGSSDDGTITSSSLGSIHGDWLTIDTSLTATLGFLSGGDWWNGSVGGSNSLKLNTDINTGYFQHGVRCALELP